MSKWREGPSWLSRELGVSLTTCRASLFVTHKLTNEGRY
jgi:hypothetical protein